MRAAQTQGKAVSGLSSRKKKTERETRSASYMVEDKMKKMKNCYLHP